MTPDSKDNDDIKQHLLNIEARLDRLSTSPQLSFDSLSSRHDDEIDLREIWNVLWNGKWWVVGITFLFAVAGVLYALSLPNMYKSEGIYAPAQKQGGSALGGQLGGLASLAGVNIGADESNDVDQAMALITSWPFLESVILKYDLKPLIMGVEGWSSDAEELIWDDEIYDSLGKKWVRKQTKGKEPEPSSYEVYKAFKSMIEVNRDAKNGMVSISVEYFSPVVARQWVEVLANEINTHFKERDKKEAQKNIEYLQDKVEETSLAEMHAVFYGMIEAQLKTLMLAEVGEEYLLKEVVAAKAAELKSKPKRAVLVFLAIIAGGFLSVLFVFILYVVKKCS